jgi:hypothetical protein
MGEGITWTSFTQRKADKRFCFFSPTEFLCTIGYHQTITLLRIWVAHGVPACTIVLVLFFKNGFNRASNYLINLGNFAFQGMDMVF